MISTETTPFDLGEYLDDNEAIAAYMSEAFETQDPEFIADAPSVVTRAGNVSEATRIDEALNKASDAF